MKPDLPPLAGPDETSILDYALNDALQAILDLNTLHTNRGIGSLSRREDIAPLLGQLDDALTIASQGEIAPSMAYYEALAEVREVQARAAALHAEVLTAALARQAAGGSPQ